MKRLFFLLVPVLAGMLYLQWQVVPVASPEIPDGTEGGRPDTSAGVDPGAFSVPLDDIAEYQVIVQRPLFMPDRRPPEVDETGGEAAVDKSAFASLDFNAVIITPKGRVALVRDTKSGEVLRLSEGKEVLGWTVKRVDEGALVVENGENVVKIALREFKAPASAPPLQARPDLRTPGAGRPLPPKRIPPQRLKRN